MYASSLLFSPANSFLQKASGKISFTADLWSDHNLRPFLGMTAHWIAEEEGSSSLQLKSALVAFQRIWGPHDGPSLANVVFRLLDRAGITKKVRRH